MPIVEGGFVIAKNTPFSMRFMDEWEGLLTKDNYGLVNDDLFNLVRCQGLKTGMYYLRTRAAADAIKFTVDTTLLKENGVYILSLILYMFYTIVSQKLAETQLITKSHICRWLMASLQRKMWKPRWHRWSVL